MNTDRAFAPLTVSASLALLLAAALTSLPGMAADEPAGPAERAGQQIDQKAEQAGQKADEAKAAASAKATTAGEYLDDSAITAKVKLAILRDPELKVFQISVTTTDSVVKLTGAVDTQLSIDRASAVARATTNVKSVDNVLTIKQPG